MIVLMQKALMHVSNFGHLQGYSFSSSIFARLQNGYKQSVGMKVPPQSARACGTKIDRNRNPTDAREFAIL